MSDDGSDNSASSAGAEAWKTEPRVVRLSPIRRRILLALRWSALSLTGLYLLGLCVGGVLWAKYGYHLFGPQTLGPRQKAEVLYDGPPPGATAIVGVVAILVAGLTIAVWRRWLLGFVALVCAMLAAGVLALWVDSYGWRHSFSWTRYTLCSDHLWWDGFSVSAGRGGATVSWTHSAELPTPGGESLAAKYARRGPRKVLWYRDGRPAYPHVGLGQMPDESPRVRYLGLLARSATWPPLAEAPHVPRGGRTTLIFPLTLPLAFLAAPPVFWLFVAGRRLKRALSEGPLCPKCGYDLRATPDRCPECGNEFATKGLHEAPGRTLGGT